MYTINVSVTEVDDKIIMKGLAPVLIWGIAWPIILLIPDDVLAGLLLIIYFLSIVPIAIFTYKKTAPLRNQVYRNKILTFDIIDGKVFLDGKEVNIILNPEGQFIISMKNFYGYAIAWSDTQAFFEFLETNEIPYKGYAFDYRSVPDGVSHGEWEAYLRRFLSNYKNNVTEKNKMDMLEQLEELAIRETYEIVDEEIEKALSKFLLKHIDFENFEIMDSVTLIVINIGLKSLWDEILLKKDSIANSEVVELIEECDEKYGEHIEDPYWDYMHTQRPIEPIR